MYHSWKNQRKELWNVSEWVEQLCERLEILRELAAENQSRAIEQRKQAYDRNKVERVYAKDDLVLCRVPGIDLKLEDAWRGPFKIVERLGEVNYRVVEVNKGRKPRVVHVNSI